VSFVFSGLEAGLLAADPVRLRHDAKQRKSARRMARLLEHPQRLLVTVLIITAVADILAILLATRQLVASFGITGYVIAGAAAIPVYLFVLGVLAKSLFRRMPFSALGFLGGIVETATIVLSPVLAVGEYLGRLVLPRRASDRTRLFAAREELKQVAVQSEREGSLSATERAMIHNVVDFRSVRVRDVMAPLAQAVTVRPDASIESVLQLSNASGVDCFPVVAANGQAIGLVNVLDIVFERGNPKPLASYTRRLVTAGDREPAYRVLRRLRAARLGLAAVVDAQKKLIGIATDDALIKRLVQSA
jgi:CBS domain containing-hemolysin-like protein